MKSNMLWGLAAIGLITASAGVNALDDHEEEEFVAYEDAMQCSALYTLLSASSEGEEDEEELLDLTARWLVVAMARDGTEDGSLAQAELEPLTNELISKIEEMPSDEAAEELLTKGLDFCEAEQALIGDEFDSIELG